GGAEGTAVTLAAPVPLAGNGRVGRVPTGKGTAQRLFGLVREIRAEVQNMARSLDGVDAALTLQAAESRSAELGAAIAALNAILDENRGSVDARFVDLREILDSAPVLSDAASDEVVTLENLWHRLLGSYVGLPLFAILGGVTYLYVITRGIPLVGLSFSDVTGLGPTRFGDLLSAYVLLAAGQIAHIVVEAVKQQQRGEDSFRAIDD